MQILLVEVQLVEAVPMLALEHLEVLVELGQSIVQHTLAVVEEHHKEAAAEAAALVAAVTAQEVSAELLEMELMD